MSAIYRLLRRYMPHPEIYVAGAPPGGGGGIEIFWFLNTWRETAAAGGDAYLLETSDRFLIETGDLLLLE